MFGKGFSLLIGYFCGSFLTAEVVARKYSGKGAAELGDTGNPGMANIMSSLGFLPGMLTLAGDLGKCIVAVLLSYLLFHPYGKIVVLYSGLGCTLGHDFPFWRGFRGGKGVATTSMAICLYAFAAGLAANAAGMLTVFITKYLCIGGPVIPLSFTLLMILKSDREAVWIAAILTALSVTAHGSSIKGIRKGTTKQTDVPGLIRSRGR